MTKKIALLADLSQAEIQTLEDIAPNYDLVDSLDSNDLSEIEIVFGWDDQLKTVIEEEETGIKWIQHLFAGVEKLPLETMKEKNIQLTSGSGTNDHAVTESTMALILSLTRHIVEAREHQKQKDWYSIDKGYELKGKTMLIVGAGKIGERIAAVAQAFLMTTIGINRSGNKIQHVDEQYLQADLPEVVQQADIVVNILPATPETKDLYDRELFKKMKKSAIFVNVGRGESVVEEDLVWALNNGEIAQAALDVFKEEPLPRNHPFWEHPQILITPHIAGKVERQLDYSFPIFVDNLKAYLAGEEFPHNLINLEEGY